MGAPVLIAAATGYQARAATEDPAEARAELAEMVETVLRSVEAAVAMLVHLTVNRLAKAGLVECTVEAEAADAVGRRLELVALEEHMAEKVEMESRQDQQEQILRLSLMPYLGARV